MSRAAPTPTLGGQLLMHRLASARPSGAVGSNRLAATPTDSGVASAHLLPEYVLHTLASYRLLQGIPFHYLVPDAQLVPAESIRFFTVDPEWLDALIAGALTAGSCSSRELFRARAVGTQATWDAMRRVGNVREVLRGQRVVGTLGNAEKGLSVTQPSGDITGMMLRSELVANWPGLHLRAWSSTEIKSNVDAATVDAALVVNVLRMERLNPSLLLALFHGRPRMLWIEEPHHEVQLGIERRGKYGGIRPRDESGAELDYEVDIEVPMREDVPGVVDIAGLVRAIDAHPNAVSRGSSGLAKQLLRAPSRKPFVG